MHACLELFSTFAEVGEHRLVGSSQIIGKGKKISLYFIVFFIKTHKC